MIVDLFSGNHWVIDKVGRVEIDFAHIDGGDLVVVITSVIGDTLIKIITRTINGDFELGGIEFGLVGAAGLVDGVENVEILADAGEFVVGGTSMLLSEGGFDEARFGIHAARQKLSAETTAIMTEGGGGGDGIAGVGGGDGLVVSEVDKLIREDRVIGENADWIIIDMKAISGRFDDDGFFGVGNNPVKFAEGQFGTKVMIIEIHVGKFSAGFGDAGASAENVRDKLVGRNVVFAGDLVKVNGVTGEHEAGDAKTLVVHGVVVKRVILAVGIRDDVGDTDDGVMLGESGESLELEWEVVRCDSDGLVIRKVEIEVATEISVFGLIDGGSAHNFPFLE